MDPRGEGCTGDRHGARVSYNHGMPRAPSRKPADPAVAAAAAGSPGPDVSVEGIAQALTAAIVSKRLPPGTWLREEALGRVYAVSRTKIRAALLMLAKDRLIETIPDKGAFVSRPSVQEAREVFAVRRVLESEVVRLFVARASMVDHSALQHHIRVERETQHEGGAGNLQERLLGDFHVVLAERAGNRLLAEMVRELVARSSLIAMLYQSDNDPNCATDEHEQFLRIARSGDVEAAVDNMLQHLRRVESSLHLSDEALARQPDLVKALLA